MKKAKRFETQKDIELHAKFTKKKLLCHGGLKLKSFFMMCKRISESDWRGCRNQAGATLTIGRQILKATGMEAEIKKRVCPADCILFSYGVEFGTRKYSDRRHCLRYDKVKSFGEKCIVTIRGKLVHYGDVIAWGLAL